MPKLLKMRAVKPRAAKTTAKKNLKESSSDEDDVVQKSQPIPTKPSVVKAATTVTGGPKKTVTLLKKARRALMSDSESDEDVSTSKPTVAKVSRTVTDGPKKQTATSVNPAPKAQAVVSSDSDSDDDSESDDNVIPLPKRLRTNGPTTVPPATAPPAPTPAVKPPNVVPAPKVIAPLPPPVTKPLTWKQQATLKPTALPPNLKLQAHVPKSYAGLPKPTAIPVLKKITPAPAPVPLANNNYQNLPVGPGPKPAAQQVVNVRNLFMPPTSIPLTTPIPQQPNLYPPPPYNPPSHQTFRQPPPSPTSTPPPKVTQEAQKILQAIDPYFSDNFINSGKFTASVITPQHEDYVNIKDYVVNSQAHDFGVKFETIVKLDRTGDLSSQNCAISNPATSLKMMLWHGTKANRVGPILEGGFRKPDPKAQMFGQGIYFADRVSKSAQYCADGFRVVVGNVGYIFLCEVQLGRIYNARNPNHSYTSPPNIVKKNGESVPCDSLMCTGQNIPNRERQRKLDDVIWCVGPTIKNTRFPAYTTLYNEFIVYNPNQVKIKYLVKVRFMTSPHFSYDDGLEDMTALENESEDSSDTDDE